MTCFHGYSALSYRNHSSYKFLSKLRSTEEVDGPLNDVQLSVYKKCKRFAAIIIGSHWNDKFTEIICKQCNCFHSFVIFIIISWFTQ